MGEGSLFGKSFKKLYKAMCQDEWNPYMVGILIAFFSILMMAWNRPWGATGAVRNWADWILYGLGTMGEAPKSILEHDGSVIGIGFVAGAFLSACLGNQFAFRFPPFREYLKAVIAGILMGVGAALAGGCNVGGFYNSIGNLSASGFAMMLGLVLGAVVGLKALYWEMEHLTFGSGGSKTVEIPFAVQLVLGLLALVSLIYGAYCYAGNVGLSSLSGVLLIAAVLGYAMQRGRWCMIQGFREPHMTGDCTLAKSVALSVFLLAIGAVVLHQIFDAINDPDELVHSAHFVSYVRGTFGWGGVVGGFLFGIGAMFAGGCGTGTLWRVGEGQIKLWLVVPFFGISNTLFKSSFSGIEGFGDWVYDGITDSGKLGEFVYMPDTFLGYGGTLALIGAAMAAWYMVVKWNEDSDKLIVPM
ncbi:MAG: YeeE/YedE thiosulfate transporter family protein [Desulfurivibrionaceae bacterium]